MIDSVVMDATKQEIIKAISHPQNRVWKLDFIQGKGEGQIIFTVCLISSPILKVKI
jgi:hypothetical protein